MPHEARPDRRDGPPPTRVFPPLPTDPSALPALPRAFDAALDAGLEALGLELPGVAREAIESHVRLLLAWNAAVNLTAITDPAAVALKHVVDSLAAVPMLEWVAGRDGGSFLDLGSGGGFPGLPLAAALPAARATLVDSVGKKARFLAVATRASGLADRVRVVNARAEALAGERTWDAVTARGVAGLDELVELALPLLAVGGRLVAWKRGRIDAELAAAGRASRRIGGSMPEPRAVDVPGLEGHVLVVIEKLGPTPDGYPRDPAERRGRPWGRGRRERHSQRDRRGPYERPPPRARLGPAVVRPESLARLPPMRVAVISDVHANAVALDAVLAAIGSVDAVWQLGDVVGYGPDPNGVIRRLREVGAVGVRGNHDAAAVGGSEIEWFNPDARRAMEWTRTVLDPASVAWLEALPERRTIGEIELVHGSPRQPLWEYVTSPGVARANLDRLEHALGLHGHTHVPAAWRDLEGEVELTEATDGEGLGLGGLRALVNPGSVGQPRDGDPRAAYLLLDPETGAVTWHRVPYDVAEVQHAMRRVDLPPALVGRLAVGF